MYQVKEKRTSSTFQIFLPEMGKRTVVREKEKDEAFGRNEEMNPYSISLHGPTCVAWELCWKHSL